MGAPDLVQYVAAQEKQLDRVASAHATTISLLAQRIANELEAKGELAVVFGCTHNSRRSILSEVWASIALASLRPRLRVFSAGSHPMGVAPGTLGALERAGFTLSLGQSGVWQVAAGEHRLSLRSKRFDDLGLADRGFGLVVNCSALDEACPIVPGSVFRTLLIFNDPRSADGTAATWSWCRAGASAIRALRRSRSREGRSMTVKGSPRPGLGAERAEP